jgi:membrane protein YqaA with SNARE-associated domain
MKEGEYAKKQNHEFTRTNVFSYNKSKKKIFICSVVLVLAILIGLLVYYFTALKDSDLLFIQKLSAFFSYLFLHMKSGSLLGAFYTTLIGGLFFIPIPMDIFFINFISNNSAFIAIPIFLSGLCVSFGINYWLGSKLTYLSKRIIGIKKFYKVKTQVNHYGSWGIFLFNVLPLPAQILSVIAGVFNYNKTKFYVFFVLGQAIKFSVIAIGYFYIV